MESEVKRVVVWRIIPLSKRLVTLVTLGKPLNGVILYIFQCLVGARKLITSHNYGTSPPFIGKSRNSMNNGQCSSILPEGLVNGFFISPLAVRSIPTASWQ